MIGPERPGAGEYGPYFERYVALVPPGDVRAHLRREGGETPSAVRDLTDELLDHRYAPGKWSVRAVLSHVADTERVMAFRMLWAARCGEGAVPGFDQDRWAEQRPRMRRPCPASWRSSSRCEPPP